MNHQVLKNECDIKFDDCLKNTHIKNKKVFDFAKIKSLFADFHIFVLATNRGSFAKTTGAKQLGLDEWKKNHKPSLWLKNTVAQIEDEQTKFASVDVCKVITEFSELKEKHFRFDLNDQKLFDLQAINGYDAMKGTRVAYNNIFYDEINEKAEFVRKGNIVAFLNSILASTDNQVANFGKKRDDYLWLMCNYKDMNNLILLSLGIEKIDDEVTTYDLVYDNVRVPFLVVIRNRYNQDEQDKFIKHNLAVDWRLAFGMASGDYKHSYFNEAYNQEMEDHNVLKPQHIRLSLLSSQMKIKAPNNEFLYFSKIANKRVRTMNYWLCALKNHENLMPANLMTFTEYNLNLHKLRENQKYDFRLKDALISKMASNKLYFDSIKSRTLFIETIK